MSAERPLPWDEREPRELTPEETARIGLFRECERKFGVVRMVTGREDLAGIAGPLGRRDEHIELKRAQRGKLSSYEVRINSADGEQIMKALITGPKDVVELRRGLLPSAVNGIYRGELLERFRGSPARRAGVIGKLQDYQPDRGRPGT